jgi:hypothetical protein
MASSWVYFQSDGSRHPTATQTHVQAMADAKANADRNALFIYGGDIYDSGTCPEFELFDGIYRDALPLVAAVPGNHDWYTTEDLGSPASPNVVPKGFECYWQKHVPPSSRTPIEESLIGASRHHFTLDLGNGWLGVFIDCGMYHEDKVSHQDLPTQLTPCALERFDKWISGRALRNVVVFLHHARLSCGVHPNNTVMDDLWQHCFDAAGLPLVAAWVGGHNHNMGIYCPRGKGPGAPADPIKTSADAGVYIFNNGAGGESHYHLDPPDPANLHEFLMLNGTMYDPDEFHDGENYGFLRIEFVDENTAIFQNYSTGPNGSDPASAIEGGDVTISLS